MDSKMLDFALTNSREACERFVDVYGLRSLFPLFMGKGLSSKKGTQKENEEHALSALASLFKSLEGDKKSRLIAKFFEGEYEKTDRLMELWEKYFNAVKSVNMSESIASLEDQDKEEAILMLRLEQGLFCLQLVAVVIAELLIQNDGGREALQYRTALHLHQIGQSLLSIEEVLVEYAQSVGDEDYKVRILDLAQAVRQTAET